MKKVYGVMVGTYSKAVAIVCQNEDEAIQFAVAMNDIHSDKEDPKDYVIELPYICDSNNYDINDVVMTAIVSTKKVYEDIINQMHENPIQYE